MPERRPCTHPAGYTLVEVLVALTILAMALTVLLRMFSLGLASIDLSTDYTTAVVIAENQLAAFDTQPSDAGTTRGRSGKFIWTRTAEVYHPPGSPDEAEPGVSAYQVSVIVEWPGARVPRRFDLTTLKIRQSEGRNRS